MGSGNGQFARRGNAIVRLDAGRRDLRTSPPVTRHPLRRPFLRRGRDHRHLLPARLSGSASEGRARALLPLRGSRREGGISPLPALSPRSVAGKSGMVGIPGHRAPRSAPDRGRGARRCRHGRPGATTRHRRPTSGPAVQSPRWRVAGTGRFDVPPSSREAADRRHRPAVRRGSPGGWVRQRPPLQRRVPRRLRSRTARAAPPAAGAGRSGSARRRSASAPQLPGPVRRDGTTGLSGAPRHPRRGGRRCRPGNLPARFPAGGKTPSRQRRTPGNTGSGRSGAHRRARRGSRGCRGLPPGCQRAAGRDGSTAPTPRPGRRPTVHRPSSGPSPRSGRPTRSAAGNSRARRLGRLRACRARGVGPAGDREGRHDAGRSARRRAGRDAAGRSVRVRPLANVSVPGRGRRVRPAHHRRSGTACGRAAATGRSGLGRRARPGPHRRSWCDEGALTAIPGIGPWTAEYIAMRALRDPDAFPAGDLGLRKAAANGAPINARELGAMAETWRPWRAYAAMLLWQDSAALQPGGRDAEVVP